MVRTLPQHLLRQSFPHPQPRLVDRYLVDNGIWPRKIHVLEYTGVKVGFLSALLGIKRAIGFNVHRLTRRDVPHQFEARGTQRHALGGNHVLLTLFGLAHAITGRANAVGVSETDDAISGDHGYDRIGAAAAFVHGPNSRKNFFLGRVEFAQFLKLMGKHVQQDFGIRVCVDVAEIGAKQITTKVVGVGQITVVRQGNTVGAVDVKRLRFRRA